MTNSVIEEAVQLAEDKRKELALGNAPIKDIFTLLEAQGIFLVRMPMDSEGLSGAFYYDKEAETAYMLINSSQRLVRQRFTAAHEYCHYLLDKEEQPLIIEDGKNQKSPIEIRADCFAANFLAPAEGLVDFIKQVLRKQDNKLEDSDVVKIKHEYDVSWSSLIYRLHDLRFTFENSYKELAANPSRLKALALQMGYVSESSEENVELKLPSDYSKRAFEAYFDDVKDQVARIQSNGDIEE